MDCISNRISDYSEEDLPTENDEREAEIQQLRDEADLARRKAVAIQKLLADLPLSQFTVPDERTLIRWHVKSLEDEAERTEKRIAELQTPASTRKSRLREEFKTLQKTWLLTHEGLEKISQRQAEIEVEMMEIEEQMEVAI